MQPNGQPPISNDPQNQQPMPMAPPPANPANGPQMQAPTQPAMPMAPQQPAMPAAQMPMTPNMPMQQPAQMPMPTQQAPFVPPAPVTPSFNTATTGKSKVSLLLGGLVGVLVLLGLIGGAYMMLLSPAALSKKASVAFMNAATSGNKDALYKLSDATSADDKAFLDHSSDSVKGSYTASKNTSKDGKYYYLYSLTGATSKYARTIVAKKDGKWLVNDFVYSTNELALIPGKSTDTTTSKTDTPAAAPAKSATPVASTAKTCIVQDDYKWMNYNKINDSVSYDSTYGGNAFNKTADMFFKPDSTEETSFLSTYDDWADFAKHAADKQWIFHLEGSVYGKDAASVASKKLASERSNKVKDALISRGVPADRIVIDTPHDYSDEPQDSAMLQIYRRVQILVDPTCTSAAASTSGR
jgi:outer membrane protein OmpA-like peptidoglycan-associated protein